MRKKSKEKISKYLSNLGLTNRRDTDDFFKSSKILLNKKNARFTDFVSEGDVLNVNGEEIIVDLNPKTEILIYHKPVGQICSNSNKESHDNVFNHLPERKNGKWIMVGRLDVNTSGLILFSNNGDLVNVLMHPSSGIDREYLCRVYGETTDKKISNLVEGVKIGGELCSFSDIAPVKKSGSSKNNWFYVCIFSGKNREVRKLWETQKLTVNRLIRVRFGSIFLPDTLKKGQWKNLSKKDIESFFKKYSIQLPKSL